MGPSRFNFFFPLHPSNLHMNFLFVLCILWAFTAPSHNSRSSLFPCLQTLCMINSIIGLAHFGSSTAAASTTRRIPSILIYVITRLRFYHRRITLVHAMILLKPDKDFHFIRDNFLIKFMFTVATYSLSERVSMPSVTHYVEALQARCKL